MQLTQTAEYALRAMAHLSLLPPGEGARAKDLAEASGIPMAYVSKLLRKLVVAGLLESQKGHGGGFVLARPAAEIRFVEVLRAVDYPIEPNHCAFGWGQCNVREPCPLHGTWSQLKEAFSRWAERTTLADVQRGVPPRGPLLPSR
jgi:Rrf2 family protein